jgi:hypothetical protein
MTKNLLRTTLFCIVFYLLFTSQNISAQSSKKELRAQQTAIPNRLFGLTIDGTSFENPKRIKQIIKELKTLRDNNLNADPPTIRIVLPVEADPNYLDKEHIDLIKELKQPYKGKVLAYVMAEIMDSFDEMSSRCFIELDIEKSKKCYLDRANSFYEKLKKENGENYVDIWEIGNEINGDWFGETEATKGEKSKRREITVAQIKAVYDAFEEKGLKTAITYYFNDDGNGLNGRHSYDETNSESGMTKWIVDNGDNFKNVDYVLISYYPDNNFDGNSEKPIDLTAADWKRIFALVEKNYSPNTKFGIGEMGTHCQFENCSDRNSCQRQDNDHKCSRSSGCCPAAQVAIINQDYSLTDKEIRRNLSDPMRNRFVGGYFYWFYSTDVINPLADGNRAEKTMAENTRKALIESYRRWGNP